MLRSWDGGFKKIGLIKYFVSVIKLHLNHKLITLITLILQTHSLVYVIIVYYCCCFNPCLDRLFRNVPVDIFLKYPIPCHWCGLSALSMAAAISPSARIFSITLMLQLVFLCPMAATEMALAGARRFTVSRQ
jgi:hypothetical protein